MSPEQTAIVDETGRHLYEALRPECVRVGLTWERVQGEVARIWRNEARLLLGYLVALRTWGAA